MAQEMYTACPVSLWLCRLILPIPHEHALTAPRPSLDRGVFLFKAVG